MRSSLVPRALVVSVLSMLCAAQMLQAQALTNIGATSAGTPVFLEPRSVSKAGSIVTATFRVALSPTIKTSGREMVSMRSTSMIDCAAQTSATKERWFYYDTKYKAEARHDVPGKPGYGPAIKGSLADVALKHFCTTATKK